MAIRTQISAVVLDSTWTVSLYDVLFVYREGLIYKPTTRNHFILVICVTLTGFKFGTFG